MADPVYKRISDLDSATLPAATGDLIEVSQSGTSKKAAWGSLFGSGWFANLFAAFSAFKAPDADHADNADTLGSGDDTPADLHDAAQLTGVIDLGRIPTLSLDKIPAELTGKYAAIPRMEVITSGSGTWTVPDGIARLRATLVGGGGGGNIGDYAIKGAGAGAKCIGVLSVTPGASYSYAIGAAGATAGANGGATTLIGEAHSLSAGGGNGASTSLPGAGGSASGGTLNIPGENGYGSKQAEASQIECGIGGSTTYGRGAVHNGDSGSAFAAAGYGAGGASTAAGTVSGTGGLLILEY